MNVPTQIFYSSVQERADIWLEESTLLLRRILQIQHYMPGVKGTLSEPHTSFTTAGIVQSFCGAISNPRLPLTFPSSPIIHTYFSSSLLF